LSKLNDSADITPVATPGTHISAVVDRFGEPTEYYESSDGTQAYLYAEGVFSGYTSIDADADGIVLRTNFID